MKNEEYLTDEEDIASRVSSADLKKSEMNIESSPVVLSKEVENKEEADADSDVLNDLSDNVRAAHRSLKSGRWKSVGVWCK